MKKKAIANIVNIGSGSAPTTLLGEFQDSQVTNLVYEKVFRLLHSFVTQGLIRLII